MTEKVGLYFFSVYLIHRQQNSHPQIAANQTHIRRFAGKESVTDHTGNLILCSVIDNLTKGASGQAVQNLNIRFGLDEAAGLL